MAPDTELANALNVLIRHGERRAKHGVARRLRHHAALPREKWIG
jgi:hypothetical protein